ncbi:hypothetical protein QBC45DRAFT_450782 [Copromyces sp. CBS 386.78]|nr:hypothetical protein QBC45DRAFT_450782 [Copromyces sp. CBS 386.78]
MQLTTLIPLAFAATALSQTTPTPTPTIPEGYRQSGSGIILLTPEQQWWIKDGNTKSNTNFCLDAGTGRSNGSPLTIQDCAADTKASSQNWLYQQPEGLTGQAKTELCVDLYTGSVRDNTKIVLWQCISGDRNHQWKAANVTITTP